MINIDKLRRGGVLAAVILTVLMCLAGCGGEKSSSVQEKQAKTTSAASATESEAPTEKVTETSSKKTTAAPEKTSAAVTEAETEPESITVNDIGDAYVEYHFRSQKQLSQHFEKHGGEFAEDFVYATAEEYEKGASDVINNPDALFKYEAEDGDGVYYLEETNEFVILSTDGYIRTYFRPSAGKKYFDRQ